MRSAGAPLALEGGMEPHASPSAGRRRNPLRSATSLCSRSPDDDLTRSCFRLTYYRSATVVIWMLAEEIRCTLGQGRSARIAEPKGSGGNIENIPMSGTQTVNAHRFVSKLVRHGASQVSIAELVAQGQIIWAIGPDQVLSGTCIRAEEFMLSAARSSRRARGIMARMMRGEGRKDADLMTALKKYVEDTCGAIKEVDNVLKRKGSSLETLLFEIPGQSADQVSWRNLIGRRDVIAHQLLTVDDEMVYREAERDFGSLEELISRVYFGPITTDFRAGRGAQPLLRLEVLDKLTPAVAGERLRIGTSIVFVFEDLVDGFVCLRMGRTEANKIVLAAPHAMYFSIAGVDGMENVKDDKGLRAAVAASRRNEQGAFVDPKAGRAFAVRGVVGCDA